MGCYQYRGEPLFDKRVKTELIVSQVLLICADAQTQPC
ncbi:protein of unknown function [Paraburkholderia dioscoreae]|uniref:Uncharacterized protein n=1 Tax=Paraburkholderia dioscoreae TaxID=2604047 RepID=A0A5Q4YUH3_9BURK|nr:protein of unknown function [Paraburkholderia dioscoreae]